MNEQPDGGSGCSFFSARAIRPGLSYLSRQNVVFCLRDPVEQGSVVVGRHVVAVIPDHRAAVSVFYRPERFLIDYLRRVEGGDKPGVLICDEPLADAFCADLVFAARRSGMRGF